MHGNIEKISKDYGCSMGAAALLARHIQDLEADWAYARDFINDRCIARVPKGSQDLLAKGGKGYYRWQFYLRAAFFNPAILRLITNDFFAKFGWLLRDDAVQLAGVESASTPLLTAFALEASRCGHPVNVFSIRKAAKAYGRLNWIEGIPTDRPVLLVDDLVSDKHYTMLHAMKVLDDHQIPMINHVYAALYKTPNPTDAIERKGRVYRVSHVFSLNDFDLLFEDYESRKRFVIINAGNA